MSIDLKRYSELKEKEAVNLVKAGDSYAVSYKKFDSATGENLPDEVFGVNLKELQDQKKFLQVQIDEIDVFIKSCEALV